MEHLSVASFAIAETANPINQLWTTIESLRTEIENLLNASPKGGEIEPIRPATVRSVIMARKLRAHLFNPELFSEPAWDMLLELYAVHLEQRRVATSELCLVADVPLTTALRWLNKLHHEGLTIREGDSLDGRRAWIRLTTKGAEAMEQYFRELPHKALASARLLLSPAC